MSNDVWGVEDDDEQAEAQGPANLRKAYKELKARYEESENARKQAEKASADLEKKYQATERKVLLQDEQFKGVPAAAKRWMERDKVDPTVDAITEWLNENGEDFGYKPGQAATEQAAAQTPTQQTEVSSDDLSVDPFLMLNGSSPGGNASTAGDKITDMAAQFQGSKDLEGLMRQFREQGIPVESTRG